MEPIIRPARQTDLAFVTSSYLKTMRARTPYNCMTSDVYYPHQRKRIENALQVGDCYVLANPEDPDHIFGYAVVEHLSSGDIVHFIYIKFPFRKMGLARKLFSQVVRDQGTTLVSHTTDTNFDRLAHKYKLIYDPYVLSEAL